MKNTEKLLDFLLQNYQPEEFPALLAQYRQWRQAHPWQGMRLLDATPLFRNTLAKYLPLLAGGAEVTVSTPPGLPFDAETARLLPQFQLKRAGAFELQQSYDLVLDCAGKHAGVKSRFGYVELTRSGIYHYQNYQQPVFLADEGQLKLLETSIGTGDGFIRALQQLGYTGSWKKRRCLIFGAGKVGRGIAYQCLRAGAKVLLIDDSQKIHLPAELPLLDWKDREGLKQALSDCWCLVSATGKADALQGQLPVEAILASDILLANMGVEDEFGPEFPPERVLNRKKTLNFILAEPTQLRYIDPTLALANAGALSLLSKTVTAGLQYPAAEMEAAILADVRQHGCITTEINWLQQQHWR